jgi:hypothetical protein
VQGELLRAAPWRALLGLATAAAVLGAAAVALGGGTGARCLQLVLVLVGAAAACCLDEPAAAVVDACPVPRRSRLGARALASLLPAVPATLSLAGWAAREPFTWLFGLELLGCTVLGLTAAALARRRWAEPGEVVCPATALALLCTVLVDPLGRRVLLFPLALSSPRAVETWAVALGACVVALLAAVPERRWR